MDRTCYNRAVESGSDNSGTLLYKKMPEKSAEKKITKKTQGHYAFILSAMHPSVWYKTADFINKVPVGERRIKSLLSELVELGMIGSSGSTKGKRYRIKE